MVNVYVMERGNVMNDYKYQSKKSKNPKEDKIQNSKYAQSKENEMREDIIEGRNGVIEALKSDRTIEQILIAKGDLSGSINLIIALAKEKR